MEQSDINDIVLHPEKYLPNVRVDNVIFGYHDRELKVLLQRLALLDKWNITGGFIKRSESIEEAAERVTFTRTGLKSLFLQQFRSFGNADRGKDIEINAKNMAKLTGLEVSEDLWIFDRFVSVGFYTLTEFSMVEIEKWPLDAECKWWPVSELPELLLDDKLIITEALRALRMHIAFFPIGYELLPEKFTLPEIHNLYTTILGRSLDERNFQKRLLASGIVIKLSETRKIGAHRSPFLYRFDKQVYEEGLKSGVELAF